jgi:hypothetical protein
MVGTVETVETVRLTTPKPFRTNPTVLAVPTVASSNLPPASGI